MIYLLKYKKSIIIILQIVIFAFNSSLFSNNLVVSNISITGQNTTYHYSLVKFDIAWDNSWNVSSGPSNWDAAWVFIKYRVKAEAAWKHATLHFVNGKGSPDGHTEPANCDVNSSDDNGSGGAYGVFIRRNIATAQGSVSYSGVKLRWDYGVDGLSDSDSVELNVFAIEMVYIPDGSFYIGSGGTEISAFYSYPTTTNVYNITSESAITVGTSSGNLYYNSSTYSGDQSGPIPSDFPKGYDDFYCMKYEISQDQYTDFLNKLTSRQEANRFPNKNGSDRHAITGTLGSRTTSKPYLACNYLSWADLAAYLDWAGLRPMSELEYEKACRGVNSPVANEYVWGTTSAASSTYTISNDGASNESIYTNYSTTAGNIIYGSTSSTIGGPLRCGIFSANSGNTGRETAGATYYGIMDMSGNVWERSITVGNATGRAFDGQNGDGVLDLDGDANPSNWPNSSSTGAGFRGAGWLSSINDCRTSDRHYAEGYNAAREKYYGGRGVRLAPNIIPDIL